MMRTSDHKALAAHMQNTLQEIADYAGRVGDSSDLEKIRSTLRAITHQLQLASIQTEEHIGACEEAQTFRELPEWDIAEGAGSKTDASSVAEM